MSQTPDPRSVPQLLSDLARELTTLFRKEGQLIRAELSEKATQLQIGAGSALAGAIVLLVSLNVLAAALVVAISKIGEPDIGGGWAALTVGIILAVIGVILVKKGASNMTHLTPERSVNQVSQDAHLVKEQVR
jgi:hypothetical protein